MVKKNLEPIQMRTDFYSPGKKVSHTFRGRRFSSFIKSFYSDALGKSNIKLDGVLSDQRPEKEEKKKSFPSRQDGSGLASK